MRANLESAEEIVTVNQKRARPSDCGDAVTASDGTANTLRVGGGVGHDAATSEPSVSTTPSAGGRRGKGIRSKRRKSVAALSVVAVGSSVADKDVVTEVRPLAGVTATAKALSGVSHNGEVGFGGLDDSALEAESVVLKTLGVRTKGLFEWVDGPLVTAMRKGEIILLDELSLAEDAVLERLNSVLEPGRSITLAEKGGEGAVGGEGAAEIVVAAPGFRYLHMFSSLRFSSSTCS